MRQGGDQVLIGADRLGHARRLGIDLLCGLDGIVAADGRHSLFDLAIELGGFHGRRPVLLGLTQGFAGRPAAAAAPFRALSGDPDTMKPWTPRGKEGKIKELTFSPTEGPD